ncbi:SET domain-containing protein [Fictibacillus sp. KIGAM418]|uniref:SET domain-containing protein n=1 Tax=Fictibacillus marinisediminis TaxID=2878389 RepID=A0A9X2BD91_9BACL|nr:MULTISPECIES: SET domain-containing protein [Fictibacillus]MCK6256420.1 SET domain-containing protein [Fictibacillus marinisediminis]UZJ77688.1 SET domain-containing protein [Fictibacillus sp. KU28468]
MFEIRPSRFGRGIFATRSIKKGELIHRAPVIASPKEECKYMIKTVLADYVFNWGDGYAIALGYGSLFNHSYSPNARYKLKKSELMIDFYAYKDINADEEILVNYNGDPEDDRELWFKPI